MKKSFKQRTTYYYIASFLVIALVTFVVYSSLPLTKSSSSPGSVVFFKEKVVPILEDRCAVSCHGIPEDTYQNFMEKDEVNGKSLYFPVGRDGKISRNEQSLTWAFQAATGHSPFSRQSDHSLNQSEHRIDYAEPAHFSALLRVPLVEDLGGLPHMGMDLFYSTEDSDYQTLQEWVTLEISEHPAKQPTLSKPARFFRDNILGVMSRNGCFLSSCHGPDVFNDLKLRPPLPVANPADGHLAGYSTAMVLAARAAVLGNVARFANLGGSLERSRLILKNLPISEGGVHQRGGNNQFFSSMKDQDVQQILAWLQLEQERVASKLTSGGKAIPANDLGRLQGLLFIRGPRHMPRKFFDLDTYWPGSDIYMLRLANGESLENTQEKPINLTKILHPEGLAEFQSFDVRYDGKAVVLAMRTRSDKGFRLYELILGDDPEQPVKSFTQLSYASARQVDGTLIQHIDPLYIPGPHDTKGNALDDVGVAFASNEAGAYAASDTWGLLGEADGGTLKDLIDRQRTEAPGSLEGRRVAFVDGPNKGQWRRIVRHEVNKKPGNGSRLVLDSPLSTAPDRRSVYVIEKLQSDNRSAFDIWTLVPQPNDARAAFDNTRRRFTFSNAQERRPTMRTSGEVMFTTVRNIGYQGDRPVFNGAIFRSHAGGFDYHIQGGNRSRYPLFVDSREMPSGLEVRTVLDPRNYWGGSLVLVDHGLGVNIEPDNPVDNHPFTFDDGMDKTFTYISPPRYLPAQLPLFQELGDQGITHTGLSPGGAFRDPYPLPNGGILTAHTANPINHLDQEADPDWDIYRLDFSTALQSEDGRSTGDIRRVPVTAVSSDAAEYSPRPLVVRLKEKSHTHQKFISTGNLSEPVDDFGVKRMPAGTPAEIEAYDYPLLQSFLTNFAPLGAKDFHLRKGNPAGHVTPEDQVFHFIRVIMDIPEERSNLQPATTKQGEQDPFATRIGLGVHTRKVIIAEVPLEKDGSFYAQVPPNVPLILQGLNRHRMALHSINRWFFLQPGEKLTFSIPRSIFPLRCAGCHGSLTGQPADSLGPPDLVSAASQVMATWNPLTKQRRLPAAMGLKSSDYIGVDFKADVQPILNNKCVTCHGGDKLEAGLDLSDRATSFFNVAYESLHRLAEPGSGNFAAKKYLNEREGLAIESPLIARLAGHSLQAKGEETHLSNAPHPATTPVTAEELLTLTRWIDLGASFQGGRP